MVLAALASCSTTYMTPRVYEQLLLGAVEKDHKSVLINEPEAAMVSKNARDVKEYISSQVRKGYSQYNTAKQTVLKKYVSVPFTSFLS